jgi:hypothetical protein
MSETPLKQPAFPWINAIAFPPQPFEEVLVWIDSHRGPSWRNNHALVAYLNERGEWLQERHPSADPLVGVLYYMSVPTPE